MRISAEEEKQMASDNGKWLDGLGGDIRKVGLTYETLAGMYYSGQERAKNIDKALDLFEKGYDYDARFPCLYYIGEIHYLHQANLPVAFNIFYILYDAYFDIASETEIGNYEDCFTAAIIQFAEILISHANLELSKDDEEYLSDFNVSQNLDFKKYIHYKHPERLKVAVEIIKRLSGTTLDPSLKSIYFFFAQVYEEGKYIKKNLKKAAEYYGKALQMGHPDAKKNWDRLSSAPKDTKKRARDEEAVIDQKDPSSASQSPKKHKPEHPPQPSSSSSATQVKPKTDKSNPANPTKPQHIPGEVKIREFNPQVSPDKIPFSIHSFFKPKSAKNLPNNASNRAEKSPRFETKDTKGTARVKEQLSEKAKVEMGEWGERYVYTMLKERHRRKYNTNPVETSKGYTLNGHYSFNKKPVKVELHWLNAEKESGEPKDFKMVKIGKGVIKECYFEVKATESDRAHPTEFSGREFEFMQQMRKKQLDNKKTEQGQTKYYYSYTILRVFKAGTPEASIEVIKDPYEKFLNGELKVSSIGFNI